MTETYSAADQHDGIDPDMADGAEKRIPASVVEAPNRRGSDEHDPGA
jgi:hypothetical protein